MSENSKSNNSSSDKWNNKCCKGNAEKEAKKKPQVTINCYGNEYEPGRPNSAAPEHFVNFQLASEEYLVQCPYDNSHRILPHRMGRHLLRCRRSYEDHLKEKGLAVQLVACPWTNYHILPEMEIQYHAAQCDYRGKTREELEAYKRYCPPRPDYGSLEQLITESWSDELSIPVNTGTYSPQRKLETEPIIYFGAKGMSKSKKRAFRDSQRLKFYHLVSGPFWQNYRSGIYGVKEEPRVAATPTSTEATMVDLNSVPSCDKIDSSLNAEADRKIEDDGETMVAKFIDDPFLMRDLEASLP